ncbi:MAG: IMP cyclohydrolase [Clostridiales bacterium]|nr:IMP cyclohydrolase [Clostridiales bacterium]
MSLDVTAALSRVSYPGRGIIMGLSGDAGTLLAAYFIMGRSQNSRNRVLEMRPDGLYTRAADESKVTDPSLIIYRAATMTEGKLIVTNGDQTDTVYSFLKQGKTFGEALSTRVFEPDAPHFTPRISGLMELSGSRPAYSLSIIKAGDPEGRTVRRCFFDYEALPGVGHYVHTYRENGAVLPPFEGEPEEVLFPALDGPALAQTMFEALDPDNRISLCLFLADTKTGSVSSHIVNRYGKEAILP